MNELHLFAGVGGGILGGMLLGHTPVCAVEIEPYRRKVLLQRQVDGILPAFPIWDDIKTFDGKPWGGIAECVCGGFPCQDISLAGGSGEGIEGEKSGLWKEMFRVVCEVHPRYVFVENSPAITFRGIDRVLGDLAVIGYNAKWGVFSASDVGAKHERIRMFIMANSTETRWRGWKTREDDLQESTIAKFQSLKDGYGGIHTKIWDEAILPAMGVADGVAVNVDGIAAAGDGQVPAVVRLAWETLI